MSCCCCGWTLALLALLCCYWWRRRLHMVLWAFWKPGPKAYPILGSLQCFMGPLDEVFNKLVAVLEEFPQPLVRLWIGTKLYVVIREPHHIEKVLRSHDLTSKGIYGDASKTYFGEGMLVGFGKHWCDMHKLVKSALDIPALSSHCASFRSHAAVMSTKMEAKLEKEIVLEDEILPNLLDAITEVFLGVRIDTGNPQREEVQEAVSGLQALATERLLKPWLRCPLVCYLNGVGVKQDKMVDCLRGLIMEAIDRKKNEEQFRVMQEFIRRKTGTELSEEDAITAGGGPVSTGLPCALDRILAASQGTEPALITEALLPFLMSSDAIATTASFCLRMLALHPYYQNEVLQELRKQRDKQDQGSNGCLELPLLERCIKETLRLFPDAPFMLRQAINDIQLSESETLPSGITFIVSAYSVHRDQRYWQQPDNFFPDHFLPEKEEERPSYAYIPFSAGPRKCIGEHYTMTAVKILVSEVLEKFRLTCLPNQASVDASSLKLGPGIKMTSGNKVMLHKR